MGIIVDTIEVRIGNSSQVLVEQNYNDVGVQDQITTLAHGEDGKIQNSVQGVETNPVPSRILGPPTQSHVREDVSPASSLVPFTKLELSKNSCTSSCNCVCHQRQGFRSPDFLSRFVGLLYVGYTAMPWAKRKCDNSHCHDRSIRITYVFPSWFWARAIAVSVESAHKQGPELCLRVMRIRPASADTFQVVYAKDTYRHLRRILSDGNGSIFDVDPYGDTGLHVRPSRQYQHRILTRATVGREKSQIGMREDACACGCRQTLQEYSRIVSIDHYIPRLI